MAATNKSKALSEAQLHAACGAWNSVNPIGANVVFKKDGVDEPVETKTRSEAFVLCSHTPVIFLEGVGGCYHLDHVRGAKSDDEKTTAVDDLKSCFKRRGK